MVVGKSNEKKRQQQLQFAHRTSDEKKNSNSNVENVFGLCDRNEWLACARDKRRPIHRQTDAFCTFNLFDAPVIDRAHKKWTNIAAERFGGGFDECNLNKLTELFASLPPTLPVEWVFPALFLGFRFYCFSFGECV